MLRLRSLIQQEGSANQVLVMARTRVFLRVCLAEGRRVVVRDPDRWADLQEEVGERTYVDLPPAARLEVRALATAVQVVAADSGDGQDVLAEFSSLAQWERRGRGLHRTPLWLPSWLVACLKQLAERGECGGTLQGVVTEMLISALRAEVRGAASVPTSALFLRLRTSGSRVLIIPDFLDRPLGGRIQEEVGPSRYWDVPTGDPLADLAYLRGAPVEQVQVMAACGAQSATVAVFPGPDWWAHWNRRQFISPRLPGWLVWRLDQIKRDGLGSRRKTVEGWLIASLVRLAS